MTNKIVRIPALAALALAIAIAAALGAAGGGAAIAAEPRVGGSNNAPDGVSYPFALTVLDADGDETVICFILTRQRERGYREWDVVSAPASACKRPAEEPTPTPAPIAAPDTSPVLTGWTQRATRHYDSGTDSWIIGYAHTAYCWNYEPCPTYTSD